MHLEEVITLCLWFPQTTESMPFGPDVLVYKVAGKMFALASPDKVPPTINLKCDPDRAIELRDQYEAVQPGYHMNKRHWNTVTLGDELPDELVAQMIQDSHNLVVKGLPKKVRDTLSKNSSTSNK